MLELVVSGNDYNEVSDFYVFTLEVVDEEEELTPLFIMPEVCGNETVRSEPFEFSTDPNVSYYVIWAVQSYPFPIFYVCPFTPMGGEVVSLPIDVYNPGGGQQCSGFDLTGVARSGGGQQFAQSTPTRSGSDVLPTEVWEYAYSSGDWQDQLVSITQFDVVDGYLTSLTGTIIHSATYNNDGSPTSYGGNTLTWEGKRLTDYTNNGTTTSFTYDESGIRTSKITGSVTTNYYYNGALLIGMTQGNDTLRFSYGSGGSVISINLNGTDYYYLRNGQGDVVALMDGSGSNVVEYTYDTWGKPTATTGTLAATLGELNPFRYRGYVYDECSGFYYCLSRYYDPEVGRFISADALLSTGQGVLGYNMYAYCLNNPVNGSDPCGTCFHHLKFWTDCEKCAAKKAEKKAGVKTYPVPLFNQGSTLLCWAYVQTMDESYKTGTPADQAEADTRAEEIAKSVHGENDWNKGSNPTNIGRKVNVNTIQDLCNALVDHGPLYANYQNPDQTLGHGVIVTGVDVGNNIVYTNNPQGTAGQQTFEEFLKGYTGNPGDLTLYACYRLK